MHSRIIIRGAREHPPKFSSKISVGQAKYGSLLAMQSIALAGGEPIFLIFYISDASVGAPTFLRRGLFLILREANVRGRGLEPPRPCGHGPLKPARLPVTSPARMKIIPKY